MKKRRQQMSSVDIREVLKLQERNMSLDSTIRRCLVGYNGPKNLDSISKRFQRFRTNSFIVYFAKSKVRKKKLSIRLMSKLYVTPSIKEEQKFLIPTCSTLSKRRLLICRRSNARGFITESSNTGTRITEIKDASWLRNGSRENIC